MNESTEVETNTSTTLCKKERKTREGKKLVVNLLLLSAADLVECNGTRGG